MGKCPEVEESKLEAYAMITAMGPTYMWFQWQELRSLAESFGMSSAEAATGVAEMVSGAANTLFGSGMPAEEVIDLIPVKPLGEEAIDHQGDVCIETEPPVRKAKKLIGRHPEKVAVGQSDGNAEPPVGQAEVLRGAPIHMELQNEVRGGMMELNKPSRAKVKQADAAG